METIWEIQRMWFTCLGVAFAGLLAGLVVLDIRVRILRRREFAIVQKGD